VNDPQAYWQAAVQWHFSPETGSRYWLERAKPLDFDPVTEVKTEDLARSPTSSASYATWLFGTWCRGVTVLTRRHPWSSKLVVPATSCALRKSG
jgi:hypothetical protein